MKDYYLIYDDSCPICRVGTDQLRKLDRLGLVKMVPLSRAREISESARLDPNRLKTEIHLVLPDGRIFRGAEALATVAALFPRSRLLGWLIMIPPFKQLARLVYRIIARHRLKISAVVGLK